jgi:flagellar hook-associated protein 1 FlgK
LTNGLKANVFNKAGDLVGTVDLGSGYEAGKPIEIGDGVSVAFGSGLVADGESFTSKMVANSDTGGLLSALGLNSFFQGSSATDIVVSQRLLDNPSLFSTGLTGDSADSENLKKLLAATSSALVDGQSGSELLTNMSVEAGSRVQVGAALEGQLQSIKTGFENDRDSFSGVDLNEELVNLTRYQKSYEASLRVLQSIDQMYDETLRMLG